MRNLIMRHQWIFKSAASIFLFILFIGYQGNSFAANYQLSMLLNPPAGLGGTVVGSGIACGVDCSELTDEASAVTLTATAAPGWQFDSWSGDIGGITASDPNPTFTMGASDRTITATFSKVAYTLSTSITPVAAAGFGVLTVSPGPYNYDTSVTLSAPDLTSFGWQFVNWTGDVAGVDVNDPTPPAFAMGVGNRTIAANYARTAYTLTTSIAPAAAAGFGSLTVSPAGPYYYDTSVTLTAPDLTSFGWQFVNWSDDGAVGSINGNTSLTPPPFLMGVGNRTIAANYTRIGYTLNTSIAPAAAAGFGSVAIVPAAPPYNYDTSVTLTAPNLTASGWQFDVWSGDVAGITTSDPNPTFLFGPANRVIVANYKPIITATTVAGGTITPAGVVGVTYNANQSFAITPSDAAHCVDDVLVDGVSVGDVTSYTFSSVIQPHTIHASAYRGIYTVTGNIEPASVRHLALWRLRDADTNTIISGWMQHGQVVNVPCGVDNVKIEYNAFTCYTQPQGAAIVPAAAETSIAANTNPVITGTYTLKSYNLTLAKTGTGNGTVLALPSPPGGNIPGTYTFECGTTVNVIATQDLTSDFIQWNGNVNDPTSNNTTISLYQNETVSAVFDSLQYTLSLAVSGTGAVSPAVGNHLYNPDTIVNLSATPGPNWSFKQWIGDVADMNSLTTTVTMSNNQTVTAVFEYLTDPDADNDGDGYTENGNGPNPGVDCNDGNAAIHPGATEICGDGIDQDCSGSDTICTNDADGDGWDPNAGDCDDTKDTVYPGAPEICGDGKIQDCNRIAQFCAVGDTPAVCATKADLACAPGDQDNDNDGYSPALGDCDDTAPLIHPGTVDICGDGIDQDCYDGDRQCGIADTCVDISDEPLNAQIQAAPANIMFLLDDSGSMDWTMLVGTNGGGGGGDGQYRGYSYIMDNAGDNAYSNNDVISFSERRFWESQWTHFNNMYYNPQSYYFPWADNTHVWDATKMETWPAMADANIDYPRSNPMLATPTMDFTTTSTNAATPDYTTLWESGGQRIMVQRDTLSSPANSYTLADAVKVVHEHSPVTYRIIGSENDAEQYRPGHSNGGDTDITSGDLDIVCDNNVNGGAIGLRFVNIALPPDYSPANPITEATIQFKASSSDAAAANFTINGEYVDNSQAFVAVDRNITNRALTANTVNWSPGAWTNNLTYSTNNLASIVNQIITRPGWVEGNSLTFVIKGTGCRRADTVNASSADAPLLTLKTATTDMTIQDIIVDNRDSLFQWTGSWESTTSNTAYSTRYFRTNIGELAADPETTATWLLNIPKAGFHRIYTWNPEFNNSDINAPYTVYYNGGVDTGVIRMNQRARANGGNAGQWFELVKRSATTAAAGIGATTVSCADLGSTPVVGASFKLGTQTQLYTVTGGNATSLTFTPALAAAKAIGTTIEFENWWYFTQDVVPRRSHSIHRAHYYTMSEVGKTTTTAKYTASTSTINVNSVTGFNAGDVVVIDGVPQYYPLLNTTTSTSLRLTRSISFSTAKPLEIGTEVKVLRPYLVMLDSHDINKVAEGSGAIQYYKVVDNDWDAIVEVGEGNNMVDYGELTRVATPPADIVPKKNFVKSTAAAAVSATSIACQSTVNPVPTGVTFTVEGDTLTHTVTTGTTATSIKFTPGLGIAVPVGKKIIFNDASISFDRTFSDEKQNFANWFSFFGRRELSAKAAVGRVIADMTAVNIGMHTINNNIRIPVQEVKPKDWAKRTATCTLANNFCDNTDDLLTALYNLNSNGGTPLQTGLQRVGDYFDCHNTSGGIMNGATEFSSPYKTEAEGGSCQQAFAIVMTDGYYNGTAPDIDRDGNNATAFNADGNGDTAWDGGDYADTIGDTLGDIAMHYYERDLSTTLPGQVPKTSTDQNPEQHMVTYSVAFGAAGTLPPKPAGNCPPDCTWPVAATYSNLTNQQRIDDLFHAAVNGRGTFVTAADPQELVNALLAIKHDIELKVGSGAAVGITPSGQLSAETYIFQGTYDPEFWSGDISAYQLVTLAEEIADQKLPVPTGIKAGNIKYPAAWTANETMKALRVADPHWWGDNGTGQSYIRQVVSYNGTKGVPFLMPVNPVAPTADELTIAQLGVLGASNILQQQMIDYLRGDATNEQPNGLAWRSRLGKNSSDYRIFGDFVHSAPMMVVTKVQSAGQGDGIDNNNKAGTDEVGEEEPKLVIGANDGGLHVLNPDDDGKELFTYVPGLVMDQLSKLATPNPLFQHQFYVDNTIYAKKLGDAANAPTLAVGGLGKGGKGYYLLDLSAIRSGAAEQKAGDIVKWEYPNGNLTAINVDTSLSVPLADTNGYMGYSFSQGYIVKSNKAGEWMVVFGNGYESSSGKAALILLGINASGNIIWRKEIDTGVGDPIFANHKCNGLSSPALIDVDFNGTVDYAFAGDLLGNMWKFDLTSNNAANWEIAFEDGLGVKQPLFTANYALNRAGVGWESTLQPITTEPEVILPCKTGQKGYMVLFGTGRYLKDDEFNDVSGQTLYGIWDWTDEWVELQKTNPAIKPEQQYLGLLNLPSEQNVALNPPYVRTLAQYSTQPVTRIPTRLGSVGLSLLEQVQISGAADAGQAVYRFMSSNTVNWYSPSKGTGEHLGWFFNLPGDGERMVSDVSVIDGILKVITVQPSDSPCSGGTVSIAHGLDACTGGTPFDPYFDINNDGKINEDDLVNIGSATNPRRMPVAGIYSQGMVYNPASIGLGKGSEVAVDVSSVSDASLKVTRTKAERTGVVNWREID